MDRLIKMSSSSSSLRNEDDDFFGIQYIQSSYENKSNEKEKRVIDNNESVSKRVISNRDDIDENELSKMDGTDFIDASFFPELRDRRRIDENMKMMKGNEEIRDIWEEQYFNREERIDRSIGDEHIGMDNESSDTHTMNTIRRNTEKKKNKKVQSISLVDDSSYSSGLDDIRSQFIPFWNMNNDQLIDHLSNCIVYNDGNMLALDKPSGLAYSGSNDNSKPQLDRLINAIKNRLLPKCERLYTVLTLDRSCSGIVLFATTSLLKSELQERLRNGEIIVRSCGIVRGKLPSNNISIQTPLMKSTKNGQLKLYGAKEGEKKGMKLSTKVKVEKGTESHSLVDIETTSEVSHQIRCHLSLCGSPLIGDNVYGGKNGQPMRYPSQILEALQLSRNQSSKLPMFLHRKEISIPSIISTRPNISIQSPLPSHFVYALKKLSLLKRR